MPQTAAVVATARRLGARVVGELEIGWRLVPNELLAITGSNGKTTTVELIGRVYREAGLQVEVAGNVGTALTSLAGAIERDAVVVCEASSFQLEDTELFAPEAAVLLNLARTTSTVTAPSTHPHRQLEAFARQPADALAVAPTHHRRARRRRGTGRVRAGRRSRGPRRAPGWRGGPLIQVSQIRLRGPHNRANAMAAAAVCLARGLPADAVRNGLDVRRRRPPARGGGQRRRRPVRQRLQGHQRRVRRRRHRVVPRRRPHDPRGRGKHGNYGPLADVVAERAGAVSLIGEAAAEIGEALAGTGVPLHDCGDLAAAVAAARAAARPGEVVLLSPACASYDQYRSFEERGDHFRALVS